MLRLYCKWLPSPPAFRRLCHWPSSHLLFSFCFSFSTSASPNSSHNFTNTPQELIYLQPDFYDSLLKSCSSLHSLKQIHSSLTTTGIIQEDPHLSAQIIIQYSKFQDSCTSRSLFGTINGPSSFLWNTMIRAYANDGHFRQTLELYWLMLESGIGPNNYTYPFVLKACGSELWVLEGKFVHGHVIKSGFQSDLYVEAGLVDMYAAWSQVDEAHKVFDGMPKRDLISWTAMITAYEKSERPKESLQLLSKMQEDGFEADGVTVVSVASAVAQLCEVKWARSVHAHAIQKDFLEDVIVANALVAMYSKCGEVNTARVIFDAIGHKDGISWNAMLSGYVQNGLATEALALFDKMGTSDLWPNSVTGLIIVSACAHLGSLNLGRKVHSLIVNSSFNIDTTLWNAIMDMYTKCGDLDTTIQMFNSRPTSEADVSSWNVIMSGYGMHGRGREALDLFSRMQQEGVEPNHITFTCLLSACSHAGLVDEGKKLFDDMRNKLFVSPTVKHYACMVDLFGRAGHFKEACNLIEEMPSKPNDGVWGALLGACRIHKNAELGAFAAKNLFQLEPEHTGYYVLMSNVYASSGKWNEVGNLRQLMKGRSLKKPAAFSVIEFGKEVHGFHTSDQCHPQWPEVYKKVESLVMEIKMAGYVPDSSCFLHDVEEEEKDILLNYHSEKLAVAFGLMNIEGGLPIYVTKNLRICHDCHLAFKFISQTQMRKIIVRDANRFHHFQDGTCSCQEYW